MWRRLLRWSPPRRPTRCCSGGEYRVIPNGVHVDPGRAVRAARSRVDDRLRIVFVGQPVERKGLPVLLRAFEALREQIPAELVMIGPSPEQLSRGMPDRRGVRALGPLDDQAKRRELELADVLCAPSLGGESFGMVLTEALAAATPVVASEIAGYRDIVRDCLNGVLVPPSDPRALASALRDLWAQPERRAQMGRAGAAGVQRFAWPRIAAQVLDAYHEAIATTRPSRHLSVRRHGPAHEPWGGVGATGVSGVVGLRTAVGQARVHERAA
jgi:phosphatidylinositol alpha-mannosyltransferase